MELWAELFSDWVGVLSFFVLAFILVMGAWFTWYFVSNMSQPPADEDSTTTS
ncbi:MAG: DUF3149 domain-containing protein [Burkholderiaceae bacterium]